MPKPLVLLLCTCIIGGAAALFGCAFNDAYRYETIKEEYTPATQTTDHLEEKMLVVAAPADGSLTLPAVLAIARANNPDLLMAGARIERSRAMLEKSAAPYYPQINIYTEYVQGDAPSAYLFKTIDQRKLPPDIDFNHPGWFENFESGIGANVNLYNGGKDRLSRKMAAAGVTISQLDRDGVENQVMATAIGAYYDVLAADQYTRVAEDSVETTRSLLRIMDVRFQKGGALKADLLSLQVRLAETEELLVQNRNRRRLAKAALAEILGIDPETPFDLTEEKARGIDVPEDRQAALAFALAHRPELAGMRQKLRQSKMTLDASRAGYLPQLDFMTRYYVADPEMNYSTDRDNWTAGLYLNWNIFDGFATKSSRAEALARLQETLAADRKTLLAVKFDVKKAYLNLDEAEQRLKVAASSVETAEETYGLIKRQYQGGSANITRYLEAELAYNRARMRETTAFFDWEKALAQIARAIGHWSGSRATATYEE
jgi:outer membrane protein TolC